MATSSLSTNKSNSNIDAKYLKSFHLIWLDDDKSENNQKIEDKLRNTITQFTKFQDTTSCQQYIENLSADNRIAVLINIHLGNELIPLIVNLQQVSFIWIYNTNSKANEHSFDQCGKVKISTTKINYFISIICLNIRIHKQEEDSSPKNLFTVSAGDSTLEVAGEFVFLQTLIDCLQRMKPNKKDIYELMSYLEKKYENNTIMIKRLRTFHDTYSPDKIIKWYTAEPFVYETINTALRQRDIHMMFLWRSFLFDIYHQLHELQSQYPVKVYRGQSISKNELEALKNRIGKLVSLNSFWSTSLDRLTANGLANALGISNDTVSVLFEIEADPFMVDTKPFANISKRSKHPDEEEILFMFGSIFRVIKVYLDVESKWIIELSLCDDYDLDVQKVLEYMKKQNGKGVTIL
ncbi:hypothetical protein I4U23_027218 [Adineta vaga]|nr:hypothetical protein I4U23_027218 [Adineta vaga]